MNRISFFRKMLFYFYLDDFDKQAPVNYSKFVRIIITVCYFIILPIGNMLITNWQWYLKLLLFFISFYCFVQLSYYFAVIKKKS